MMRGDGKLLDILENSAYAHFFGVLRPRQLGIELFFTKLEFFYFTPGTEKHQDFNYYKLGASNLSWGVVSIPSVSVKVAEKVANEGGLMLVHNTYFKEISISGELVSLKNKDAFILANEPDIIITGDVGGNDVVKRLFLVEENEIFSIKKKFRSHI
jgi:hypothetical protein